MKRKTMAMRLSILVLCCSVLNPPWYLFAEPVGTLLAEMNRLGEEELHPLLYGGGGELPVEEVPGVFSAALSSWEEASRAAALHLNLDPGDLVEKRSSWYRRRFLERSDPSPFFQTGMASEPMDLALLEGEERELLSRRMDWEKAQAREVSAILLEARDDYYEILAGKEAWLTEQQQQYYQLIGEATRSVSELESQLHEEKTQRELLLNGTLDTFLETFSIMEGQRRTLAEESRQIVQHAALSEGSERAAWLSELDRSGDALTGIEESIAGYGELYREFLSSPLEEDIFLADQISRKSSQRYEQLLSLELPSLGDIGVDELRQQRLGYLKEEAELNHLRLSLLEEISRTGESIPGSDTTGVPGMTRELEELASTIAEVDDTLRDCQGDLLYRNMQLQNLEQSADTFAEAMFGEAVGFKVQHDFMQSFSHALGNDPEDSLIAEVSFGLEGLGLVQSNILERNQALAKLLSLSETSEAEIFENCREVISAESNPHAGELMDLSRKGLEDFSGGTLSQEIEVEAAKVLDFYLLKGALEKADLKMQTLENRRDAAAAQAVVYAATAAALYVSLNIPAGIAATAAAASAVAFAAVMDEKMKDIAALQEMVTVTCHQQEVQVEGAWGSLVDLFSRWDTHAEDMSMMQASIQNKEVELDAYRDEDRFLRGAYLDLEASRRMAIEEGMERFNTEHSAFIRDLYTANVKDEQLFNDTIGRGKSLYASFISFPGTDIVSRMKAGYGDSVYQELHLSGAIRNGFDQVNGEMIARFRIETAEDDAAFKIREIEHLTISGATWWENREAAHISGTDLWLQETRSFLRDARADMEHEFQLFSEKKALSLHDLYQERVGALQDDIEASSSFGGAGGGGFFSQTSRPALGSFSAPSANLPGGGKGDIGYVPEAGELLDQSAVRLFAMADMGRSLAEEREGRLSAISDQLQTLRDERIGMENHLNNLVGNRVRNALTGRLLDEENRLRGVVNEADQQVRTGVEEALSQAGYLIQPMVYSRNAVVDLWLGSREWKEQRIEAYLPFVFPTLAWQSELADLPGDTFTGESEGLNRFLQSITEEKGEIFYNQESLFSRHVGEAPSDEGDGRGELGRIFSLLRKQEGELGRGLAMMDTGFHDRRFWDDDEDNDGTADTLFAAPTVRSTSDLALQVGAGILLGPGIGSAALGLADELLFTALDYSGGRIGGVDALVGLGKSAVSSISGQLTAGNSLVSTGLRLGTGSALSSLDIGTGGISFDTGRFTDTLFSRESLATLASSAISFTGNSLYNRFVIPEESTFGFNSVQLSEMESTGSLVSSLAGTAGAYAISGELRLNILSSGDIGNVFGFNGGNTGLLSLNLSGDALSGGSLLSFDSAGVDISSSRIMEAGRGASHLSVRSEVDRFISRGGYGMEDALSGALLLQYGFGDGAAQEQLQAFLSGRDALHLSSALSGGSGLLAETRFGDQRTVSLLGGNGFPGLEDAGSRQYALMLGTMLQHEAHRDGLGGTGNGGETLRAVAAHTDLLRRTLGDDRYGSELLMGNSLLLGEQLLLAGGGIHPLQLFDSSGDYYRISDAGELLFDGSHNLWSTDGALLETHQRGSYSQTLADYLGISRDEALDLMASTGLYWDDGAATYIDRSPETGIPLTGMLLARGELRDRFGPASIDSSPGAARDAYLWALKEHSYGAGSVNRDTQAYHLAMGELLSSQEQFEAAGMRISGDSFSGIKDSASLDYYSQLMMEEAGGGSGYCLAQSLAFGYAERYPGVDMGSLRDLFAEADFGGSFDRSTGYVGGKVEYSQAVASRFGVDGYLRESRFSNLEELQDAAGESSNDFFIIADYGSHFTHVRKDGLEVNSYPGWDSGGKEPQGWRLMEWQGEN